MHELSIAQKIVAVVQRHLSDREIQEVRSIKLRMGEQAVIMPESLRFCFGLACEGTRMQGARLEIESVPGDELQVVEIEVSGEDELKT